MKFYLSLFLFLFSIVAYGTGSGKAKGVTDFSSIKDVIKNDRLEKEAAKKREANNVAKKRIKNRTKRKYNLPSEKDFWLFTSEYWLVKNRSRLKWDFKKPQYGLAEDFQKFLEALGLYHVNFKILILNTNELAHLALPAGNEYLFLLSLPFVRDMDLSKLEISLILFEDYLRAKNGYFKKKVKNPELDKIIGKNFYKAKFNKGVIDKVLSNYSKVAFVRGFSFKEQFQVTKQVVDMLGMKPKYFKVYSSLLHKIDDLIKDNKRYSNYIKIYPSPELQLGWIKSTDAGGK